MLRTGARRIGKRRKVEFHYNPLFLRYLLIVLTPISILFIMGSVSVIINQSYVSRQMQESNLRTLLQIRDSFNLTFDELDSLALSYSVASQFLQTLNGIVTTRELDLAQSKDSTIIRNFVYTSAYSRPYVQSIYVYIQNEGNKVLTTTDDIQNLNDFYDRSWYTEYMTHPDTEMEWASTRTLDRFPAIGTSEKVLSIFRRLSSLSGFRNPGVIVLNIDLAYLQNRIDQMKESAAQSIIILDKSGRPLIDELRNSKGVVLRPQFAGASFGNKPHIMTLGGRRYVVLHLDSSANGWTYVSLTPASVFFRPSLILRRINMIIVAVSLLVGFVLTFLASRRSLRHIGNVVGIVEAAEHGRPLPPVAQVADRGFGHITYSILRTFVEHKYLSAQLSARKYRQRMLELLALQSQLNPHFLFNTLETINWKVYEVASGPTEVNEIIGRLSSLLNYSLRSPVLFESLGNEIKHAEDYLSIQRVRYDRRFSVSWEKDKGVEEYQTVRFILQPILENIISHGIDSGAERCRIQISVRKVDSRIRISVIDNGRGIEPRKLQEIQDSFSSEEHENSEHIGLYNTNKRIQLAFGAEYGLHIDSRPGEETEVIIEIPAKRDGAQFAK
ncbi:MAG TPA: sensor histidine kinase [Spirochaetia bacterium]|nr:sensor histidine kinase [Spirochaetia bacterium]